MILVSVEELNDMINEIPEIHGYARKLLDESIEGLPVRGVIKDCYGCMGAAFNACEDCKDTPEPIPRYIEDESKVIHYMNGMVTMNEQAYRKLQTKEEAE